MQHTGSDSAHIQRLQVRETGHAWCIANADRRTMQEVPNIGKNLRVDLQKAYSKAGKKYNMTAFQMQAATWVAWKRIHNV